MAEAGTKTHDDSETIVTVCSAVLEVKRGADAGRKARIDSPTFVIGSGDGCELRLTDRTVSREHVRLTLTASGVRLRDGGSKNGTKIGKLRVNDVELTEDTVFELGSTTIALKLQPERLELPFSASTKFGAALGISPAMRHLFAKLHRVAKSEATVLLEGESGVGKEVLARAIHAASDRADGPFVVVDCGAIPESLIESELFGHEKGAFTGAHESRPGLFEEAQKGTLFLDEIGELSLALQPKLLRALEQREVRPVGARTPKPIDVRVVAATNRHLAEAVRAQEFRQDLYYRLAVMRLIVPPLRDRADDILPLATDFLRRFKRDPSASLPPDFAALLTGYHWPGNVRELRNVVERYAIVGDAGLVEVEQQENLSRLPYHEARGIVLERFEREYLQQILERANGVVTRAADEAELGRATLYRMMERLGISRRD